MRRIELLDWGRFAAAFAVVSFHYGFNGIVNGKIQGVELSENFVDLFKYGYLGVEFFFLISGYVISRSIAGKTPGEFWVSRLIRLYPAFWAAVLVTAAFSYCLGGDRMTVTLFQVVLNLTMIPGVIGIPYVDGVYWTLELELAFYVLVLALMMLGSHRAVDRFVIVWPILLMVAYYFDKWYWPYLGKYYYFFAAGAMFAYVRRRGYGVWNVVAIFILLFLCVQKSSGMASRLTLAKGADYSEVVIGVVVVAMFIFFFLINIPRVERTKLPGSKFFGVITYPLYLVHAHIGYMLLTLLVGYVSVYVAYAVTLIVVFLLAIMINSFVEVRLGPVWIRTFSIIFGRPVDALSSRIKRGLRQSVQ